MNNQNQNLSWLTAIHNAATEEALQLPPFVDRGMGSAICRSASGNRFVSVKRRLLPVQRAATEGVEWTLWREEQEVPEPVVVFREPLHPTSEQVRFILSALKGWLIDEWTVETAKQRADSHVAAAIPENTPGA
jgi:hypothetical protein